MDVHYPRGGDYVALLGLVNIPDIPFAAVSSLEEGLYIISLRTQTYFRLSRFSPLKNNVCVSELQNDFRGVAAFVFSLANQIT